jgi:hypothetical protein
MTKFELRLIAATLAFIPLSMLFVYAYEAYRREHPAPLLDAAKRGEFLAVTLDAATCDGSDIGELVCGKRYVARYLPESDKWLVLGPTKLNPNTIAAFATPPGPRGSISVIGIPGMFDNVGAVVVGHNMLRRRHKNAYCAHDAVRIWGTRRRRCAVVPGFAPTRFTFHLAIGLAFWLRFPG